MKWFTEGDKNSKVFHAYVKERIRKMQLEEIRSIQRDLISTTQNISEEAVNVFRDQFTETQEEYDGELMLNIPQLISSKQNDQMEKILTKDEVKQAIFELNGDSSSGPDGFTGQFF